MNTTLIFPCVLMTLNVGASIVYAIHKDWLMSVYWLLACGLTAIVTIKANF